MNRFLANCPVPREGGQHTPMSWAAVPDIRKFSGPIIKASDVHNSWQ